MAHDTYTYKRYGGIDMGKHEHEDSSICEWCEENEAEFILWNPAGFGGASVCRVCKDEAESPRGRAAMA